MQAVEFPAQFGMWSSALLQNVAVGLCEVQQLAAYIAFLEITNASQKSQSGELGPSASLSPVPASFVAQCVALHQPRNLGTPGTPF